MSKLIDKYKGFVADFDGTLIVGKSIIEGVKDTLNKLIELGKDVIIVSNKTTESAADYHKLLDSQGIKIGKGQIIVSTKVIRNYLHSNFEGAYFFAIGEKRFIDSLIDSKLKYSEDPDIIDIVIVTLDRLVDNRKMEVAAKALIKGAKFFAANIDETCPVENGEITDAGKIISILENKSRRKLEKHFGKPSKFMFEAIKSKMKFDPENYLIVGDRLQTDIKLGIDFGIDTALVSTGVKNNFQFHGNLKPTYRIKSFNSLLDNTLEY